MLYITRLEKTLKRVLLDNLTTVSVVLRYDLKPKDTVESVLVMLQNKFSETFRNEPWNCEGRGRGDFPDQYIFFNFSSYRNFFLLLLAGVFWHLFFCWTFRGQALLLIISNHRYHRLQIICKIIVIINTQSIPVIVDLSNFLCNIQDPVHLLALFSRSFILTRLFY